MVTHIVIFTWVAGVTQQQVSDLGQALDRLAVVLSDLVTIRHGSDLHFRDGNGDYALIASFADRAGWAAYQAHPEHTAFVSNFIVPIQASRAVVQF